MWASTQPFTNRLVIELDPDEAEHLHSCVIEESGVPTEVARAIERYLQREKERAHERSSRS